MGAYGGSEMPEEIPPEKFELYEQCIKSDQIPHHEVPKLLDRNPSFSKWYKARIIKAA